MTFTGFTTVTVDPGVAAGTPQARMTVSKSLVGMARAKVVAPIGKFNVVNANFTNYQAYVAGNTSMTFSGEDTYDPNGHAADANYTWNFGPSGARGWGIRTNFTYTQAGLSTVEPTVAEAGGNRADRENPNFVDHRRPAPNHKENRRGSGIWNNLTLRVD